MLNVAIGWYVYTATHNPMSLAYVGLAQFLPNMGMLLVAGQAADPFDRRKVIWLSLLIQTLCLAAFSAWRAATAPSAGPYICCWWSMARREHWPRQPCLRCCPTW